MPDNLRVVQFLTRLWPCLKWGMFLAVLIFVVRHGYHLWTEVDRHPTRLAWSWLTLAVVTSVVAWLPSAWYWRMLLGTLGPTPPWPQILRSYYGGHLGKYLPGKAAAIVIRAVLIKAAGVSPAAAALTVTVESVTYMWAGTLVAIILYPSLAPHLPERIVALADDPARRAGLCVLVICGGLAGLALLMRNYERLINIFRNTGKQAAVSQPVTPIRTVLGGAVVFLAAWWLQGLTLGLTIRAITDEPLAFSDWPFWTGTAAVALVGGFVAVFTPGGLGVREGLLMELLAGQLGPHDAVLVAVLMRGVALVSELFAAGALYYGVKGVEDPVHAPRL